MRQYIYSVMAGHATGFAATALKGALLPFAFVYGAVIALRATLFGAGLFPVERVRVPVISVGNLTLGGTGKTPFVIMLAGLLSERFARKTVVLIRGYGIDEQELLKARLKESLVLVGRDRAKSARAALNAVPDATILLDDGFQHHRLHRDMDIVLVDTRNPFGNGCLVPCGILREPITGIRRASVVVLTKTDKSLVDTDQLQQRLKNIQSDLVFAEAVHRPLFLYGVVSRQTVEFDRVKDRKVLLVSSIGDPAYFEKTVEDLGPRIQGHSAYPDHHNYLERDVEAIIKRRSETGAEYIITTEKDAVKLERLIRGMPAQEEIIALRVELTIVKGLEHLLDRLHRLYSH